MLVMFAAMASGRMWTNLEGRSIEGEFVRLDGDAVILKIYGKETRVLLSNLREADRAAAEDLAEGKTPDERTAAPVVPLPRTAELDADLPLMTGPPPEVAVDTLKEDAEANEFIYASPHFEFHCNRRLTSRLVAGFAKLYEATYGAVKAMPWGSALDPENKDGRFVVKLFSEEEDFIKAGGIPGSAGTAEGAVSLAQLKYLGVKDTGSRLILEDIQNNEVLIHELTHTLRNQADRGLPIWAVEGSAEYIAAAPYQRTGRFIFDKQMENTARYSAGKSNSQGTFLMPMRLERMMDAGRAEFYRDENGGLGSDAGVNYAMAALMTTYFWHADKGRDDARAPGAPIREWLRAIKAGKPEKEARALLLDGRSYEEIEKAVVAAYRRHIELKFQ